MVASTRLGSVMLSMTTAVFQTTVVFNQLEIKDIKVDTYLYSFFDFSISHARESSRCL